MRYLSSSVETILLSRLSRVDVDYFYKTITYSKFHGTQKRESCVTAIFRTAAKYYPKLIRVETCNGPLCVGKQALEYSIC